jgi:hypothetical protein
LQEAQPAEPLVDTLEIESLGNVHHHSVCVYVCGVCGVPLHMCPDPPPTPFTPSGCPSERAMVLAHIQKKGFMDVVRSTGIRGLYHGFEPTLYRDVTFNMAFFTFREIIVRLYRKHYDSDPNPFQRTVMGIVSGTMASVFACPFDVVKTKIQGGELATASNGECFTRSHMTGHVTGGVCVIM